MIKRLIFITLLTIVIFGGLFGLKFMQIGKSMAQFQAPPPVTVAVTEVKQAEWQPSLTAVGNLVAVSGVAVANEIPGMIKAIHFNSGQNVNKGQLLVELDSATDQAELKGLLAGRRLAQIQFERSKKLITKKVISIADYDQNQALLDEAEAAVLTKKTVIEKKQIRAPFSGKLGIRKVDLGEYLIAGSLIVELQQLDSIYLDFTVPEHKLSSLKLGQQLNVSVQAYPDKTFSGRVVAISPLLDQKTRSIPIRAIISNHGHLLYPGMFAQVQLLSGQKRPVLTLPDTAISYNPYGDFVFVVESGDQGFTVQSQQVETGGINHGRVEIIKGLSVGDRVVSAGQVKLRNGMPITIDDKPAPGERNMETAL